MKLYTSLAICACLAGLAPAGFGQDNQAASHSVFGRLDTKTGTFKPLSQNPVDAAEAAPAVAPTTGKFVANITVTVASNIPTSTPLVCSLSASNFDATSGTDNEEEATATATRSGSKATCTVTIPYSWLLVSPTQDTVSLSYSVEAGSTTGLTRLSSHSLAAIKVPANGATTTETLNVTI